MLDRVSIRKMPEPGHSVAVFVADLSPDEFDSFGGVYGPTVAERAVDAAIKRSLVTEPGEYLATLVHDDHSNSSYVVGVGRDGLRVLPRRV